MDKTPDFTPASTALYCRLSADILCAADLCPKIQRILHEAADEIDRLTAENGALRAAGDTAEARDTLLCRLAAADAYDAVAWLIRQGTPLDGLLSIVDKNAAELRKGDDQ